MNSLEKAREALQQHFGFEDFREGQADVINSILSGQNVVVVMPTGGGKSLCYQLPALMMDGVTLVVSPLIALMKDQVDALAARGIPTTFINSSLTYSEANERLSRMRMGQFKLVYIAPERFRSQAFVEAVGEVKVRLFAIDEAHCISHWGHDFRPDYLRLKEAAEMLGHPQVIALTATATPQVRADIGEQLGLSNPDVFVAGFDRPNLKLHVRHTSTEKEKIALLKQIVQRSTGAGIIYAATRKGVEQVTSKLKLAGLRVEAYHGGMDDAERTGAQDAFMSGQLQAIVATNAFGMGIDKADIRFVVHYHLPGSIEAYYQEVGRAGRDGMPADCILFFNYADTRTQQFFIEGSNPSPELISRVYHEVAAAGAQQFDLSARDIAQRLDLKNEMSIYSALVILEKAGHIERGRPTDSTLLALMKMPVDSALAAVSDDSNEGGLLRDLIFNRNVNEREQTELDLNAVSATLGLTEGQVRGALGRLAARGLISYRNAYQGRGARILDEEPARALRIDRKDLAARAAAEQWKLRRMIDFCYHKNCLRRFILKYFGDRKQIANCGTCSTCSTESLSEEKSAASGKPVRPGTLSIQRPAGSHSAVPPQEMPKPTRMEQFIINEAPTGEELRGELRRKAEKMEAARPKTPDVHEPGIATRRLNEAQTVVVRKILSCVARLKNRFGKGTVAAVLRGSSSKQILQNGLNDLSTYGLLRDMTQEDITAYIKALIEAGCITVQQGAYPTVSLTEYGREVMLGRADVALQLDL